MMNPFTKYRSKGLLVSEVAQQLWCEKRVELELLHGKEETPEMTKGSKRHQELFEEITPVFPVQPETWVDTFFVRCYQMWSLSCKLLQEKKAREMPIFGKIGTRILKGIIDELVIKDGKLFVRETKTRVSGKAPDYYAYERVVHFQMSLYKMMLDNIKKGCFTCFDLITYYKIRPECFISDSLSNSFPKDAQITSNVPLMAYIAFDAVKSLPETADTMVVQYETQKGEYIGEKEFVYDEKILETSIAFVLGFWEGARAAAAPSKNLWKCHYCPQVLRDECDVYKKHNRD
jgi:hypothetical protein